MSEFTHVRADLIGADPKLVFKLDEDKVRLAGLSLGDVARQMEAGLNGAIGKPIRKYHQKLVKPKNHRFASYVAVLNSFP